MNTEKQLIGKIRELRQIRPRKDWVVLTKSQILGEEPKILFFPFFKPVLATVTAFGILFGIFSLAQNSLPGDFLYSIKKITEKSQAVFVSEEEKPVFQLKLANDRLEELTKAPARNLAPTLSEFQASVFQAAKEIVEAEKPNIKEIVQQTKKLEENKQKVETLGIVVGETEALDTALAQLVESQIKDLEEGTLTEGQQELLEGAKESFEAGDYNQALEKILILSYPQE